MRIKKNDMSIKEFKSIVCEEKKNTACKYSSRL